MRIIDTMETIDRAACRTLRTEIAEALAVIAERHGLEVAVGGGSFDPTFFKAAITFTTTGAGETTWQRYAPMFGLPADAFGATVTLKGAEFRLTGINTKAGRFPVTADRVRDGKGFRLEAKAVARRLEQQRAAATTAATTTEGRV